MSIRAILFDLDNTLLLEDDATRDALRLTSERAARRAGLDAFVIQVAAERAAELGFRSAPVFAYADPIGVSWGEALWGDFAGETPGLSALRAFVARFRHDVWAHALAAAGAHDEALVDELARIFPSIRRSLRPIDPEADTILDTLGIDHVLGLVTNGAPDLQREKLAASGLESRFASTVISGELGIGKPDARIFDRALHELGVAAGDAVMVGDSLERDVAGARAAGLRSVWVDRTGMGRPPGSAVPDARVAGLGELPGALAILVRAGAIPQPA